MLLIWTAVSACALAHRLRRGHEVGFGATPRREVVGRSPWSVALAHCKCGASTLEAAGCAR
jgi:hypothetical protein